MKIGYYSYEQWTFYNYNLYFNLMYYDAVRTLQFVINYFKLVNWFTIWKNRCDFFFIPRLFYQYNYEWIWVIKPKWNWFTVCYMKKDEYIVVLTGFSFNTKQYWLHVYDIWLIITVLHHPKHILFTLLVMYANVHQIFFSF